MKTTRTICGVTVPIWWRSNLWTAIHSFQQFCIKTEGKSPGEYASFIAGTKWQKVHDDAKARRRERFE